jgi:hypothetical protein
MVRAGRTARMYPPRAKYCTHAKHLLKFFFKWLEIDFGGEVFRLADRARENRQGAAGGLNAT